MEPMQPAPIQPHPQKNRAPVLIVLLIVIALLGGVYLYLLNKAKIDATPNIAQTAALPTTSPRVQNSEVATGYGWSSKPDEAAAAGEAVANMKAQLGAKEVKWIMVFSTADYDSDRLSAEIQKLAGPQAKMSGITSFKGVMASDGWHAGKTVAVLGLSSDKIIFGVGTAEVTEGKGRDAAKMAMQNAITNSGKAKTDKPKIVIMNGVLGQEEDMLKGVADVIGKDIPVMGASAGDNDLTGKWKQFANGKAYSSNVVMTAIYTNLKVGYEFSTGIGYLRTDKQGIVTKATGRTIYEIDNRPAADVYNEWLGGQLTDLLKSKDKQASILQEGIIDPLAVVINGAKGVSYYLTVHPIFINLPEKSLTSLAIIETGKSISIMRGSAEAHELRPPLVIRMARAEGEIKEDEVAAGIAMFCACTHLVLGDDGVQKVIPTMSQAFGGAPFVGAFTFGEEGPVPGVGNRHQNLVQNILIFGKE